MMRHCLAALAVEDGRDRVEQARQAVARPSRCSRDSDNQVMIESYRSARCSGRRPSRLGEPRFQ
jgi:hypothetical protein